MFGRPTSSVPSLKVQTPEQARLVSILVLSLVLVAASWLVDGPEWIMRAMTAVGLTLAAVTAIVALQARKQISERAMARDMLTGFIEKDPSP
ncbi:MAG: hybrid sensor histidine kinase/response regulator, partial [Epibacterium sp.]|nr:hybrid sensor histidine kinase/response regulator [Epibacterium sp.]NQX75868.1 hybrid sensor histidine kinase/response regulator [Epibacterium sp.]